MPPPPAKSKHASPTSQPSKPPTIATSATLDSDDEDIFHDARFPPEEEASLLAEATSLRTQANTQYTHSDFSSALSTYDKALAACPNYLDYEIARLKSNVAACYLKMKEWKSAVEAAGEGLECLEREFGFDKGREEGGEDGKGRGGGDEDGRVVELDLDEDDVVEDGKFWGGEGGADGHGDAGKKEEEASKKLQMREEDALKKLQAKDEWRRDGERIRAKCLMRRARGRVELGTWAEMSGAEEDYKLVLTNYSSLLPASDLRVVQAALRTLPAQINQAKEKEVNEMMGKLKDLGNGILKPFGLSTDMFKMQKGDDGGYSMSFEGAGKK